MDTTLLKNYLISISININMRQYCAYNNRGIVVLGKPRFVFFIIACHHTKFLNNHRGINGEKKHIKTELKQLQAREIRGEGLRSIRRVLREKFKSPMTCK